ncbi:uncharacterized protein LOC132048837 [Lycium ferocissimum]|uniref:uncharacterized protein LOC132048837 n=1 Tax=Lycium ferocissimum TaxID=112874 RepID=UPI0028161298|nr:uncharacterized protein LOC132048837 [Lycium ferocissimum]
MIKAIQELFPPKTKKEVMSFLERLNYIGQFIAQSTIIVEPILNLLKKEAPTKCTEECKKAFDTIKKNLSNPPVLVPPKPGSPLLLYLLVSENAFGCVLGQHDQTGKKERAISYLSKKFTVCEASILKSSHIDPLKISLREEHDYCSHVEAELDDKPWYTDIKMYLEKGEYPKGTTSNQRKTIRRMANGFFLYKEILYKRMPDLGLLQCVDAAEATNLLEKVHAGTYGPHMNGFVLAKKILRACYYWMTMESDYCKFVQRCHQCQIDGYLTRSHQVNSTS